MEAVQKNIPELRFPEFSDEWERNNLQSLTNKTISYGIVQTGENIESGIPCVRVVDLTSGKLEPNQMIKTTDKISNSYAKTVLELHEIMFALRGEIGLVDIVRENLIGANLTRGVARISANTQIVYPNFLLWVIRSPKGNGNILKRVNGSALKEIPLTELRKVSLPYPQLPEQQKIAQFLSSVDTKIEQLSKKKQLLEQYKKGVMQQIFSQQLRFKKEDGSDYADWEVRKLGEIANITTGSSNRVDSGLDGKYTFFDRSEDIRTSNVFLFDGEAIIVAGEGSDFVPKYFIGKFDLHQRTYSIMDFKNANGKFLFYYIHFFRRYFLSQAVGSTVKSLRLPMFQKMKIQLPCKEEQTQIANFLSAIDKKIELVNTQLNKTQAFKKGLLQQMFV